MWLSDTVLLRKITFISRLATFGHGIAIMAKITSFFLITYDLLSKIYFKYSITNTLA